MLGFPYFFSGEVVRGNQIGRTLQMPTANLEVPDGKVVPPKGVYATITHIGDEIYGGVTNIGEKPTVGDKQKMGVETFLFNFDEDIYGKEIQVDLYYFLRKVMEKHGWRERLGDNMLNAYSAIRPLTDSEMEYLKIRLIYPEKFWKIANSYYHSNKAWISTKSIEKLELAIRQTEEEKRFLEDIFSFHL